MLKLLYSIAARTRICSITSVFLLSIMMLMISCEKKEVLPEFPKLYTFISPIVKERVVVVFPEDPKDFKLLIEDLGSFNLSTKFLADTLNAVIREELSSQMIAYVKLLSNTEAEIGFGRLKLDTTSALNDSIVDIEVVKDNYQGQGNALNFNSLGLTFFYDNDQRELLLCETYHLAGTKANLGNPPGFKMIVKDICKDNFTESSKSLINIFSNFPFDTVSTQKVNLIFGNYR